LDFLVSDGFFTWKEKEKSQYCHQITQDLVQNPVKELLHGIHLQYKSKDYTQNERIKDQ
jgi:hypothetical protein